MKRGIVIGIAAYTIWGVLPIYWKMIESVGAVEILAHRVVWSVLLLGIIITMRHTWPVIRQLRKRTLLLLVLAGGLLALNWGTYIWAVNNGHIVESSLGYFINPLVTVVLGVLVLRERLDPGQWVAVGLATAGVAYMTFSIGSLPWVALVLAGTFSLYGLITKLTSEVGPIEGLGVAISLLVIPAIIYLIVLGGDGAGSFAAAGPRITGLLLLTGVASALPLALFGAAAHRIPLSTLGILQYVAPSMQFLIGVFVYGEIVGRDRLIGFILVWLALAIYTGHGLLRRWRPALRTAPV